MGENEISVIGKDAKFFDLKKFLDNLKTWSKFEGISVGSTRYRWDSEDIPELIFIENLDTKVNFTSGRYKGMSAAFFPQGTSNITKIEEPYYLTEINKGKTLMQIKGGNGWINATDLLEYMLKDIEVPRLYLMETETKNLPPQTIELKRKVQGKTIKRYVESDVLTDIVVKEANAFRMTMKNLTARTRDCMFKEDRKDALFRYGLFVEQMEAIIRDHREYKEHSLKGRALLYGQAFAMLFSLMHAHKIEIFGSLRQVWSTKGRTLNEITDAIEESKILLENQPDKSFEYNIISQYEDIARLGRFLTHSKQENPRARPVGTEQDEAKAYGKAILRLFSLMLIKEVNPIDAIDIAYTNWEAAEWRKQHIETDISGYLFGYVVNKGTRTGKAYVIDRNHPAEDFPPHSIIIAPTAETSYFMKIEGSEKPISGYVTEHGGRTSHAALCLLGKPYVTLVGVKDICSTIKTGDKIEVQAPCLDLVDNKAIGSVKKVP